jgi:hydrogenase small subunit
MAQGVREGIYDLLAARGVSRRDFVKYCGSVAALLGLSEVYAPQIAAAVEGGKLTPAVWFNLGSCTGCTESMAQVGHPDVATVVLDLLSLNYFETVMAAAGKQAEENVDKMIEEGGYILIVEGTVMNGQGGNTLRIADKTGNEHLEKLAAKAAAIIAVGSCAVDGGWVAAAPNPAEGEGVRSYLAKKGIATPVINLPTCPVNPTWVVAMVIDVKLLGQLEDKSILAKLDAKGRPTLIFGSTIHDNCPRRGHFENGEFVKVPGDPNEAKGWCLYEIGCKGPQTQTDCPLVRWNRKASWCVESGAPCIGCGNADPDKPGGNWVDVGAPFLKRTPNVNLPGIGGVRPETIGAVVGGAAAAGLLVHGIASAATGRTSGAPIETEKAWDKKNKDQSAKGGDN